MPQTTVCFVCNKGSRMQKERKRAHKYTPSTADLQNENEKPICFAPFIRKTNIYFVLCFIIVLAVVFVSFFVIFFSTRFLPNTQTTNINKTSNECTYSILMMNVGIVVFVLTVVVAAAVVINIITVVVVVVALNVQRLSKSCTMKEQCVFVPYFHISTMFELTSLRYKHRVYNLFCAMSMYGQSPSCSQACCFENHRR